MLVTTVLSCLQTVEFCSLKNWKAGKLLRMKEMYQNYLRCTERNGAMHQWKWVPFYQFRDESSGATLSCCCTIPSCVFFTSYFLSFTLFLDSSSLNQTKERKDLSCKIKLFIFFSLMIPFVFYSEEEEKKKKIETHLWFQQRNLPTGTSLETEFL